MLKFLGYVLLVALAILLTGFTIATLWNWFIVPMGAITLSVAHGYGVALFAGLITGPIILSSKTGDKQPWERITLVAVFQLVSLLIGLITVQFI